MVTQGATFTRRTPSPAQSCQPVASPIPLLAKCSSLNDIPPSPPFLVHRLFHPSSCVHSMLHVIPPLIFFFHPSFFPSFTLRLFLIIYMLPLSLLSVLDSGLWLQALVFDSSLVWGSSNASMIAPTMGQGLCPSCLLHWVVFSWVLCNGNVEHRGAAYLSELLPNV